MPIRHFSLSFCTYRYQDPRTLSGESSEPVNFASPILHPYFLRSWLFPSVIFLTAGIAFGYSLIPITLNHPTARILPRRLCCVIFVVYSYIFQYIECKYTRIHLHISQGHVRSLIPARILGEIPIMNLRGIFLQNGEIPHRLCVLGTPNPQSVSAPMIRRKERKKRGDGV